MQKRKGFIFYGSFLGLFRLIKKSQRWELFEALCAYALEDELTELPAQLEGVMSAMKPQIDANRRRYENGLKGAPYGVLGGRGKKAARPENKTPNETPKEKEKEKEKEKGGQGGITGHRPARNDNAAQDFFAYYEAKEAHAVAVARRNRALAEQVEGFREAYHALRRAELDAAKAEVLGKPHDSTELPRRHAELAVILSRVGLTEKDLKRVYDCKLCNDTGFLPDGHRCNCFPKQSGSPRGS